MELTRTRPCVIASALVLAAHVAVSLGLPPGYAAAAFGNLLQSALLAVFLALTVLNARATRQQVRLFWTSMAIAAGLWLAATLAWTWVEVVRRERVSLTFGADVLFFLHIVPMMAALAVRPHRPERHDRLDFGALDHILLLTWWVYLYLVIVIPWQYISPNPGQYSFGFNLLYVIENAVVVVALIGLCIRVRGDWRVIYGVMLVAECVYLIGSQVANAAIDRGHYHTGGLYDLPLVAAMLIFIGMAARAYRKPPLAMAEQGSRMQGVTVSRLAMLAVLSLPLMILWARYTDNLALRNFRRSVTVGALIVMPLLVFVKQHLLDRELVRLWSESQHNYENLKRLQAQLVQAEKLASIGQLISGAVHEINNPLTAIIGYSDLLTEDSAVPADRRQFIAKIRTQANRVREVVANLRAFAKQIPGEKVPVDVNPLLVNAIELRALDLKGENIHFEQDLAPKLPLVMGDPNGLLQVFFHIIGNAVDALRQVGGGVVRVSSRADDGKAVLEFLDSGPGVKDPLRIFDPFYSTKPVGKGTGLGLSASYGIVQDHGGIIACDNLPGGGARFTVMLPAAVARKAASAGE